MGQRQPACLAAAPLHVVVILLRRPDVEMTWVHARTVIAVMTHVHPRRHVDAHKGQRYPRSVKGSSAEGVGQLSVPSAAFRPEPHPARTEFRRMSRDRTTFVDLGPEPFGNRFALQASRIAASTFWRVPTTAPLPRGSVSPPHSHSAQNISPALKLKDVCKWFDLRRSAGDLSTGPRLDVGGYEPVLQHPHGQDAQVGQRQRPAPSSSCSSFSASRCGLALFDLATPDLHEQSPMRLWHGQRDRPGGQQLDALDAQPTHVHGVFGVEPLLRDEPLSGLPGALLAPLSGQALTLLPEVADTATRPPWTRSGASVLASRRPAEEIQMARLWGG